jgi:UDP-N-acetylmuramyl pentapeptide phosphotransferase/UDP-N-acetylglucosamine-1-phosphate transferase
MITISSLNWGLLEIVYFIIVFISGFLVTLFIIPILIKFMKKKGYVGYDIHKNAKPEVAESGGISMLVGISVASGLLIFFFPTFINVILIFLLTALLAGMIGFIDDRKKLRSRYKILLTIFTGSIIFLANLFNFINISSPFFPFIGQLRITIIYPLLIPLIVAVFANSVNMLEGYNGEGSGTCLIAICFIFICGLLWNSAVTILLALPVLAVLIPFFLYNKYPAKIFPGDVGTLSLGAMIACIALIGSIEVAVFCALLIHIFNSFYVISSVRGFIESSDIQLGRDDIILLPDNRIKASDNKKAVLTLPRLILVEEALTEKELVNHFFIISIICGLFSLTSVIFMLWTIEKIDIIVVVIFILVFLVPFSILMYKYPKIRGIIILMILLLVLTSIFLVFVDFFIMSLIFPSINLIVISVPINIFLSSLLYIPIVLLWYYLSIKYFWMKINKLKLNELS